jgi:periplasmic divalent cation tolerance protein
MQPILVYSTFPTAQEAKIMAASLLEARLIACANISSPVTSMYRWEGRMQQGEEVVLMAKTFDTLAETVMEHIKKGHTNECPCVIMLPILCGYTPFLDWMAAETVREPA